MGKKSSKKQSERRFLIYCMLFMLILGVGVYISNGEDSGAKTYEKKQVSHKE